MSFTSQTRACLIFNPAAGQGDPDQELKTICQCLSPQISLAVKQTSKETDAAQLAQVAIEQGVDLVIAAGGDGTISAAASALLNTSIPLGVIGRGTANAFANALKVPTELEAACRVITDGTTRVVDAAYCNGRSMILFAGVGFGAETIRQAGRESKDQLGMLAYIFSGLEQLQDLELFTAELEIDRERKVEVSAGAITIANAAPATSILAQGPAEIIPDDGLLDITIIAPESTLEAVAASYSLLRSALRREAAMQQSIGYLRARHIKIMAQPHQRVMVDGELMGQTPIEVQCLPQALMVCTPQIDSVQPELPQEKLMNLPDLKISSI